MARGSKKPKNLLLEPDAIARGERYGARYGKNLSHLVSDFLQALPIDERAVAHAPIVRRLHGVAGGGKTDKQGYREHLRRKYGGR